MEQRDYIIKEIEKIGVLLQAILNQFIHRKEDLGIKIKNNYQEVNQELIDEIGINLDEILTRDESSIKDYKSKFQGLNTKNLELLADVLFQLGLSEEIDKKRIYLEKSIQLYEICNQIDKTFSIDRKNRIENVKNAL